MLLICRIITVNAFVLNQIAKGTCDRRLFVRVFLELNKITHHCAFVVKSALTLLLLIVDIRCLKMIQMIIRMLIETIIVNFLGSNSALSTPMPPARTPQQNTPQIFQFPPSSVALNAATFALLSPQLQSPFLTVRPNCNNNDFSSMLSSTFNRLNRSPADLKTPM